MTVTWVFVKHFLKEKCLISIAFFGEIIFELIRVTLVLLGMWAFLFIANLVGLGNNVYIEMLHQFSIIGFSIIYLIVLIYGIVDFYRIFNKPGKHESIQLQLDEDGDDKNDD
jgi:hypothetical protein